MLPRVIANKPSLIQLLETDREALFNVDYQEFIDVMQIVIPESELMKGKANETAEQVTADKAATLNVFGMTEVEQIRAFIGLVCFKDVMQGSPAAYEHFVTAQREFKKPVLQYKAFLQIREDVLKSLKTPTDIAAAMWSILCNDLGKMKSVELEHAKLTNGKKISHDAILAEMIKLKPEHFPAFSQLPKEYQERILNGYACGCDLSQLEQGEVPIVTLEGLLNLTEDELELYYVHTLFDVAGAAAQGNPHGSLTMHAETWEFFKTLRQILQKLYQGSSIEQVYSDYLKYRGECVGIENVSAETTALIRIASQARFAKPEQGKTLSQVWSELPENSKSILVEQLNVHGGHGKRAIFVGYGVSMLLNSIGGLRKELGEKALAEGLRVGLLQMATAFKLAAEVMGHDTSKEIFVAECKEVAILLGKYPKESLAMEWKIDPNHPTSARRVDFVLDASHLQNTLTSKEAPSARAANSLFPSAKPVSSVPTAPAPAVAKM